ncbi:MAG: hypothetical protein M1839_006383 [Geoglossum umbratile]|nr:MAG: hypothetical protein M1839_006383 [Geoglossum umbratile]
MTDFHDPVAHPSDHHSDVTYPTTENNTILNGRAATAHDAKDAAVSGRCPLESETFLPQANLAELMTTGAQAAFNAVQNHHPTQNAKGVTTNLKDGIGNVQTKPPVLHLARGWHLLTFQLGPVAENVKAGYANTHADFRGLAHSRTTPTRPAATGQPLTAYHSFFYHLLSWKNPRATLISFATVVFAIFAFRYLNMARWVFKGLYIVLGITAAAELVGKLTISHGLTSQFRPRRYYTIPRETVDSIFDELHELLNFFVLEFQRILFAENVLHTIAAFFASLLGYWLIKIVPLWGLALIASSVAFLAPLVYISNKEIIDRQVEIATGVVNRQTAQVMDIAGQHTARATETAKAYANDLSSKAQQYVGSARGRSSSPEAKYAAPLKTPASSASTTPSKSKSTVYKKTSSPAPVYTDADFPAAPKRDFAPTETDQFETATHGEEKPMVAA